ncbi:chorismate mutase [cyanobacterium endosymbiont of Rhopalodia gibberula]|nr:chorismate mutase [cyanobacterium endosymbiont of Rhopalodia gibberula]
MEGSLQKCIRVLIHLDIQKTQVQPYYSYS